MTFTLVCSFCPSLWILDLHMQLQEILGELTPPKHREDRLKTVWNESVLTPRELYSKPTLICSLHMTSVSPEALLSP